MHLTQQKVLAIVILLEGVVGFILFVVSMVYAAQAQAHMKPDSPWRLRSYTTWTEAWQRYKATVVCPIPPRSEFTEPGVWYYRRAIIWMIVSAVYWLALAPFTSALMSWYEHP